MTQDIETSGPRSSDDEAEFISNVLSMISTWPNQLGATEALYKGEAVWVIGLNQEDNAEGDGFFEPLGMIFKPGDQAHLQQMIMEGGESDDREANGA